MVAARCWLRQLHDRRTGRSGAGCSRGQAVASSQAPARPGACSTTTSRGDPPLREDIHSDWAAPFRQFVRMGRLNLAPLLCSPDREPDGDPRVPHRRRQRRARRRRGAQADAAQPAEGRSRARSTTDMLGLGDGYTIITPPDATRPSALITAESPLQCITAQDPATGRTLAGLKMFRDEWDTTDWAYLFLPGELWVARARRGGRTRRRRSGSSSARSGSGTWTSSTTSPADKVRDGAVPQQGRRRASSRTTSTTSTGSTTRSSTSGGSGRSRRSGSGRSSDKDDEDDERRRRGRPTGWPTSMSDERDSAELFISSPDALWQAPAGREDLGVRQRRRRPRWSSR